MTHPRPRGAISGGGAVTWSRGACRCEGGKNPPREAPGARWSIRKAISQRGSESSSSSNKASRCWKSAILFNARSIEAARGAGTSSDTPIYAGSFIEKFKSPGAVIFLRFLPPSLSLSLALFPSRFLPSSLLSLSSFLPFPSASLPLPPRDSPAG